MLTGGLLARVRNMGGRQKTSIFFGTEFAKEREEKSKKKEKGKKKKGK